jgi:hypothetical protein
MVLVKAMLCMLLVKAWNRARKQKKTIRFTLERRPLFCEHGYLLESHF